MQAAPLVEHAEYTHWVLAGAGAGLGAGAAAVAGYLPPLSLLLGTRLQYPDPVGHDSGSDLGSGLGSDPVGHDSGSGLGSGLEVPTPRICVDLRVDQKDLGVIISMMVCAMLLLLKSMIEEDQGF